MRSCGRPRPLRTGSWIWRISTMRSWKRSGSTTGIWRRRRAGVAGGEAGGEASVLARTPSLPVQLDSSNPMCHGSRDQGATPCRRRRSMRNRGKQRTSLCGTGVEDSSARSALAAGWRGGHAARCPQLGHPSFRHLSTAEPSGGQGPEKQHRPLCTPHQGAPRPGPEISRGFLRK